MMLMSAGETSNGVRDGTHSLRRLLLGTHSQACVAVQLVAACAT